MSEISEERSPNGDLWIDHHPTDKVVQARSNLRYWEDRALKGQKWKPVTYDRPTVDALLNAVRHMIETLDSHYEA